jgi:hypothetical protein
MVILRRSASTRCNRNVVMTLGWQGKNSAWLIAPMGSLTDLSLAWARWEPIEGINEIETDAVI